MFPALHPSRLSIIIYVSVATNMVTIRRYIVPSQAGLDKSLLEAEGIPAFVADENSASLGYGTVLGGVRLQVQDEHANRALQILDEQKESPPLPDDFTPPEETPPA